MLIRQIIYLSAIFACPARPIAPVDGTGVGPEDRTGMNSSDHSERARTKVYGYYYHYNYLTTQQLNDLTILVAAEFNRSE